MSRGEPYVICDVDGTAVSPKQAKAIIADRYTVPEEVRRRRRTRKTTKRVGRVPQQVL
jgi:2-hydroxy-3-keto-5-methylthiopentenyl-1-phosphate phosphatase